jgi:hypothetical protein
MKRFQLVGAATLFLVGSCLPSLAQEPQEHGKPQQEEAKPAPQPKPQEAKPQPHESPRPEQRTEPGREGNAQPQPQAGDRDPGKHTQQEQERKVQHEQNRTAQQEQNRRAQEEQARSAQENQNRSAQDEQTRRIQNGQVRRSDRADEHQAPVNAGNRGGRVPEEHFRAHFGRQHTFVISRPVIIDNRPRFQYSGYWFEIVDSWPSDWAYTDECYIDYVDDGYYLFDPYHPGMRITVIVVM